ncbi:Hypothetical predicted protein [Mytilus galloprovincialis]|uniref:Uncharacterized protein n=1 Tax=Mytilus galloprovincialis TaxID=29158 RepID=A0A8B6C5M1_MYTGA|nr:Hypothetical predicted protein [Mytilus galloprovincialis]
MFSIASLVLQTILQIIIRFILLSFICSGRRCFLGWIRNWKVASASDYGGRNHDDNGTPNAYQIYEHIDRKSNGTKMCQPQPISTTCPQQPTTSPCPQQPTTTPCPKPTTTLRSQQLNLAPCPPQQITTSCPPQQTTTPCPQQPTTTPCPTPPPEKTAVCPQGWILFEELCYKLSADDKVWDDAKTECGKENAILAEPDTITEQGFLKLLNLILVPETNCRRNYWIRGRDPNDPPLLEFIWTSRDVSVNDGAADWEMGEPNGGPYPEYCTEMRSDFDYKWNDHPCRETNRYICQKEYVITECGKENAILAEPDTITEQGFLKLLNLILVPETNCRRNYWIGGRDPNDPPLLEFIWTSRDVSVNDGAADWEMGEPNGGPYPKYCTEMRSDFDYKWNDHPCRETNRYICQKDGCSMMSLNFQMLLVVLIGFTVTNSQQVVTNFNRIDEQRVITNIDDIEDQGGIGNIDEIFLINEGRVSSSPTNTCDGTFLGGFLFGRLLAPMAMADGSTMTTGQVMTMTLMSMLTGVPQTAVPMVCPSTLTTTPCPSTPPQRTVNRVILCEGDVPAFISCESPSQINIVEAVYGRLDRTICPDDRILTTSCRSPTSDALVKTDCNGQTICQLVANNGKFGDPCQGTYKYLDVTYTCI